MRVLWELFDEHFVHRQIVLELLGRSYHIGKRSKWSVLVDHSWSAEAGILRAMGEEARRIQLRMIRPADGRRHDGDISIDRKGRSHGGIQAVKVSFVHAWVGDCHLRLEHDGLSG